MPEINYKKLRDDTWGITGPAALLAPGATVTVTKKSGETKEEVIDKVLWSGEGRAIASVLRTQAAPSKPTAALRRGARMGARICSCTEPGCDCHRGHTCKCGPQCVCRGGNIYDCG